MISQNDLVLSHSAAEAKPEVGVDGETKERKEVDEEQQEGVDAQKDAAADT